MKRLLATVFSLGLLGGLPLAAPAQTAPCISCAIAREEAEIQAAQNRAIVQQQLQQDLQATLGAQRAALQSQQIVNSIELRAALDQNDAAIRTILLQEQLNLLRLQRAIPKALPKRKSAKP